MSPQLRAASLSHIGQVREENQDRCMLDESLGVFGVADGVGGMPGGGEAAEAAASAVIRLVQALPIGTEPDLGAIVDGAHRHVSETGRSVNPGIGIATTLTFGCRRGDRLAIAHVGDSRCYRWHRRKLRCLTEDHSVENLARRRGESVPSEHRHALVRCVGQMPAPVPDVLHRTLAGDERYFFCTDGITRVISDKEIGSILGRDGSPAHLLEQFIALALRRGCPDNASGVLVFVDEV